MSEGALYSSTSSAAAFNKHTPKIILLAGLALLLVVTSAGWFYITYGNRNSIQHIPTVKPTHAISAIDATATFVAAYPDPYPPYTGKLAFYDPLTEPYLWENETMSSGSETCKFEQGAYHVTESQTAHAATCFNQDFDGANITIEVQMKIIQGDCGGVIFRSNEPEDYTFEVCQNGYYYLAIYKNYTSSQYLAGGKISPAITIGLNRLNVIAVVANGNTFDLYANQQKIDTIHDSNYSHGQIGLISLSTPSAFTEVVYSHIKVWQL